MRFLARLSSLAVLMFAGPAFAQLTSYHNANPLGWRHLLPVGETPGWSTPFWINFEVNEANIWSTPFSMTDKRNGNVYTYRADYEQTSAIADIGLELAPHWSLAVELPYANHNGGLLDAFIDQFHEFIQTDRFDRNDYGKYGNSFTATTNGRSVLASSHGEGTGGVKIKLKYWLWQVSGPRAGVCDCGLALSTHVKLATQHANNISTGSSDYTAMVNFGLPLWQRSGFWLSAAYTKLGKDPVFSDWPLRTWTQMYEAVLNFGLSDNWGLILQGRLESPLMNSKDLEYNYVFEDPRARAFERINSSWNSLVYWRGSESVGFRYLLGNGGSQINFLFVEDWAPGRYDSSGGWTYINNAPDVEFLTQWHFAF